MARSPVRPVASPVGTKARDDRCRRALSRRYQRRDGSGERRGCSRASLRVIDHRYVCGVAMNSRSEEHTSELQSPDHLVCRLLLEKKKMKIMLTDKLYTYTAIVYVRVYH